MNTFVQNMENFGNRTFTQNGCVTLKSSLNANVDMFAMASAMRRRPEGALDLFTKAWEEDANLAVRNLFYLRDVRGGQGERNIFRLCACWIADNQSNETFEEFISYIPEYGRWDDVIYILSYMHLCKDVRMIYTGKVNAILDLLRNQFNADMKAHMEGKPISLLAKWYPLVNNTRNTDAKKVAKFLANALFGTEKDARKVVVGLRTYMKVLEQKLSKNEWNEVDYSTVPSCANKKYSKAFWKHDGERYGTFIEKVNKGEAKMNSSALYPYDIVYQVGKDNRMSSTEWDAMWKNLPDYTNGKSAICVVDVSGSMGSFGHSYWGDNGVQPIHVALSLGLYFAQRNKGDFQNRFFTFSGRPQIVSVKGNNLKEIFNNMSRADWGGSTNIEAVFNLYLRLAQQSKPEDLPESIIIISDMEFNQCQYPSCSLTTFESIQRKFEMAGIKRPNLIFWNANSSGHNVPVRFDESGTVLVSGCSPSTFAYVMEGKTPVDFMLDVLNGKRYANINVFKREEK